MEEDIGDVVCLERTEIGHTDYTKTGERDVDSTSAFEFKTLQKIFRSCVQGIVRSSSTAQCAQYAAGSSKARGISELAERL